MTKMRMMTDDEFDVEKLLLNLVKSEVVTTGL